MRGKHGATLVGEVQCCAAEAVCTGAPFAEVVMAVRSDKAMCKRCSVDTESENKNTSKNCKVFSISFGKNLVF